MKKLIIIMVVSILSSALLLFIFQDMLTGANTHDTFPSLHLTSTLHPFEAERTDWHPGSLTLRGTSAEWAFNEEDVRIRGRGNSTWVHGYDKRPLRLRFPEARHLMGSDYPHRDWILLANHFDKTLLRNHTAFYLGRALGSMDFVPMSQFVHLYINGEYMGVYELTDERNVAPGRADLAFDPDPAISEYFLQLDAHILRAEYIPEDDHVFIVNERAYELRWPGSNMLMDAHLDYANAYISAVSHAIRAHDWNAITALIDVPSFIDFYIIHEWIKDVDTGFSSQFMQIKGQGENRRLHMGPIWDFDQTSGNVLAVANPEGLYAAIHCYWFWYLMGMPEFSSLVAQRWNEIMPNQIADTISNIRYMSTQFENDFLRNFERHNLLSEDNYREWSWVLRDEIREMRSFDGQINYLIEWLETRTLWLDDYFNHRLPNIDFPWVYSSNYVETHIKINDAQQYFSVPTMRVNGWVMLALEDVLTISDALGIEVSYDPIARMVDISTSEMHLSHQLSTKHLTHVDTDDDILEFDVVSTVFGEYVFLSLNVLLVITDTPSEWNPDTNTVYITPI